MNHLHNAFVVPQDRVRKIVHKKLSIKKVLLL